MLYIITRLPAIHRTQSSCHVMALIRRLPSSNTTDVGKLSSSPFPPDKVEPNSINNLLPTPEPSTSVGSDPVDARDSESVSLGDDCNQWSEFWEQVSFSQKNVTYLEDEGRDEMFSLVLPRVRDSHKELRLYRRVQLEWFNENTPYTIHPYIQSSDEKYDASFSSEGKQNVSADTVLGQLVEEKLHVLAKWTPLKTCDGETVLTLSVPNNEKQRTAFRLSPKKFRLTSSSYFSMLSRNPTVSELRSLIPRSCVFRLYGYRYTRYSVTNSETMKATEVSADPLVNGEVPKNPKIDQNHKLFLGHDMVSCIESLFVSPPLLTTEEIFQKFDNWKKRFPRHTTVSPLGAEGPSSFQITKRQRKCNLITQLFPVISSEESFKIMEKRLRQDSVSSSSKRLSKSKFIEGDGFRQLDHSSHLSSDGKCVSEVNVSDQSVLSPNFSLVSRKRTIPMTSENYFESPSGNILHSKKRLLPLSPLPQFDNPSFHSISNSNSTPNTYRKPSSSSPECSTTTSAITCRNSNNITTDFLSTGKRISQSFSPLRSKNFSQSSEQPPKRKPQEEPMNRSNTKKKTLVMSHIPVTSGCAYPELKFRQQQKPVIKKQLNFTTTEEKSELVENPTLLGLSTHQSKWLHSLRAIRGEGHGATSDKIKYPCAVVDSTGFRFGGDDVSVSSEEVGIVGVDGCGNGVCVKTDETMGSKCSGTVNPEKIVSTVNLGINPPINKSADQVEACIMEEKSKSVSNKKTNRVKYTSEEEDLIHLVRDEWHRDQVADGNLYGRIIGDKNQSKYYGHVGKEMVRKYGQVIEEMDSFEVFFPTIGLITFVRLPGLSNHISLYKFFSKTRSKKWIPIFHPTRKLLIRPELMPHNRHIEIKKLLIYHFNDLIERMNESIEEISID